MIQASTHRRKKLLEPRCLAPRGHRVGPPSARHPADRLQVLELVGPVFADDPEDVDPPEVVAGREHQFVVVLDRFHVVDAVPVVEDDVGDRQDLVVVDPLLVTYSTPSDSSKTDWRRETNTASSRSRIAQYTGPSRSRKPSSTAD